MPDTIELKKIVCTGSTPGPRLLITGGVHGDEFEPMAAARQIATALNGPVGESLAGTVTLVPVVNEAAFGRGDRVAEDGLDLARTCPGDPDGSATERIAHALSSLIRDADYFIDLHTGGTRLSLFPLAGYMMHADDSICERQQEMARAFNLPLVWGSDASLDGRSLSVARDANVPAIYVEYHGAAVCDPGGVQAMVDGCLNVMSSLDMITRARPKSRVVHDVQETRADSGFLQRSLPAPCAGFFDSSISIGDHVQAGQSIGCVVDPLGESSVDIKADTTGLVVCLRTFASVAKGESLAYLLEIEEEIRS